MKVLSYISEERANFYGMNEFLDLARNFPEVDFVIAGAKAEKFKPLPKNLVGLGWVDDMDSLFNSVDVCLRYPEHDGLSTFILEALARGKNVLYKYKFDHCHHCPDAYSLDKKINELESLHRKGELDFNYSGKEFIERQFNSEVIFGSLIDRLKTISEG